MVVADGGAVDLLLPVGVLFAQQVVACRAFAVNLLNQLAILIAVEHVGVLLDDGSRNVTVVAYLRSHVLTTLLRGDDDDTIRTTRTVDGGSRSILQHGEALNIIRVDH